MKLKFMSLLLAVVLILGGCSTLNNSSATDKDALAAAIDAYIQNEIYTGEDLPLMMEYQNAILSEIRYELLSFDIEKGTMDVKFTYIDVLHLADSIANPNIEEDDYYTACLEKISSRDYKTITKELGLNFELVEGRYALIQSDALANVISGGVLDYYLELMEEVHNE